MFLFKKGLFFLITQHSNNINIFLQITTKSFKKFLLAK
jgi:hypothetical protein